MGDAEGEEGVENQLGLLRGGELGSYEKPYIGGDGVDDCRA